MSIGRTADPPLGSWQSPHEQARSATDNAVDQQLVRATREEIQRIALEIAQLSKGELPPGEFFAAFLHRLVAALASTAGIVWRLDEDVSCHLVAETYAKGARLGDVLRSQTHQTLLQAVASGGEPQAVPPHATSIDPASSNPTEHLLLVVPIVVHGRVAALVEVFQRPDRGPATQRGYLRFLVEMADLAAQYLLGNQLRELGQRHEFWQHLEGFLESIHTSLDVRQTSYAVVNECRRLLDCDRVSLALGRGRRCRVVAISGLDSLDRRAQEIRLLGQLAGSVVRMREPTWLAGATEDLSPQLETLWNRYVDTSHVRSCGVLPLHRSVAACESSTSTEPFGALIIEQLKSGCPGQLHEVRAETLARHSAAALSKAVEHESLFLMPLWKLLGKSFAALGGNHFPIVLAAVILVTLGAIGLTCTDSEFALAARGKLQPLVRRTVFAGESGVIVDVAVEHGQTVEAGQILLRMRNTDLDVEITSLLGKRTTTQEQIVSVQRALLDNSRLDVELQNRLSGELLQLKEVAGNVDRQLALVRQKEQQLVVRAANSGQVVTWQVRENLTHRPVQKGQALMTLVDPRGAWELELYLPERHAGHLLRACKQSENRPKVEFMLSSHPGLLLTGQIVEVDQTAVVRDDYGNTVRVRVAVDKSQFPELRNDATVSAHIQCGQRSLGYVWFHDLIDAVSGQWAYWF